MRVRLIGLLACWFAVEAWAAPAVPDAALKQKQSVKDFVTRFHLQLATLQREDVQKDLGLSTEQVKAISSLVVRRRNAERSLFNPRQRPKVAADAEAMKHEWRRIMRECEQEAAALLTPAQAGRLEQIGLQHLDRNMTTFLDTNVIESLKITEGQIHKFEALHKECQESYAQVPLDVTKRREHWDAYQHKKADILTAEQRKKWKEMLGTPFEGAK
jgi:hypothetical protein